MPAGTFDPEIFRKKPMIGVVLSAVLLAIAIPGLYITYQELKGLGDSAQQMTVEEAVPAAPGVVPENARWVVLTGTLTPDCNTGLQERHNGAVDRTIFLASDEAKQRWFYVSQHGDKPCSPLTAPISGILKKAAPGLPDWIRGKGVTMPESTGYPLMDFAVGDDPSDAKLVVFSFVFMFVLGLGGLMVFLRLHSKL